MANKPKKDAAGTLVAIVVFVAILLIAIALIVKHAPPDPDTIILAPPGRDVKRVVVPKPVEVKPVPPVLPQPAPLDPRTTDTDTLLRIFTAWQRDAAAPRTDEIQRIYEELLRRPEVKWQDQSGGRRRRRR